MKISVIGTGYVGLVTGVSLAMIGNQVVCIGRNISKINQINKGNPPFSEPELENLLKKVTREGRLVASNQFEKEVGKSEITIIAVGTPTVDEKIDLSQIKNVSTQIGRVLNRKKNYHVVVVKSTVVPGTTEGLVAATIEKISGLKRGEFGLCMNPEFLREGCAVEDAMKPDRIVIGQLDKKSGKVVANIYKKFKCPKIFVNIKTAELIKYSANALFATMISYSNEIARIAEKVGGIDVVDVWRGVHLDNRLSPRVGSLPKKNGRYFPQFLSYIFSGCGYGGSCFPKDTKAITNFARENKIETPVLNGVVKINTSQPLRLVHLLKKTVGEIKGKKITVLGLTFKPDTDDLRESPAIPVIEELIKNKAKVSVHDPLAYLKGPRKELENLKIHYHQKIEKAVFGAEAVIIVTAWSEYKKLTPSFFIKLMKDPVIIDGRRIFSVDKFLKKGIKFQAIGYKNPLI